MKKDILYARYLCRHKWFVFLAGLKLKVPLWRLIIHDWSKLTPIEWVAYRTWLCREPYKPMPKREPDWRKELIVPRAGEAHW